MSALHEAYRALPRPMLIGHRGLNTVASENSLEAIEAARAQGADGVEIDVRPSADGTLVLVHDVTLERVAGDPRHVARLRDAELAAIRLTGGERIATLEEALALCRERALFLNVELKRDVPSRTEVTRRLAGLLRRSNSPAMIVSSFDPFMLGLFMRLAPDVPAALLVAPDHALVRHLAGTLGVAAIHPGRTLVSADLVRRWKSAGLTVMTWTVNDPIEAAFLLSIGVDGIITDDPARLQPAFAAST